MGREAWYRNQNWNNEIESLFFSKLKKSRSQKSQYLMIQAGMLLEKYPEISLKLIKLSRENASNDFCEQELCYLESECSERLGNSEIALERVLKSVEWRKKMPGIQTSNIFWYARLVIKYSIKEHYANALKVLNELHEPSIFPEWEYEFYGLSAVMLFLTGEPLPAKEHAIKAIQQTKLKYNLLQNPRKMKIGVFKEKPGWPFDEIVKISKI